MSYPLFIVSDEEAVKPGQNPTPRAASRRNAKRNALPPTAHAANELPTPSSTTATSAVTGQDAHSQPRRSPRASSQAQSHTAKVDNTGYLRAAAVPAQVQTVNAEQTTPLLVNRRPKQQTNPKTRGTKRRLNGEVATERSFTPDKNELFPVLGVVSRPTSPPKKRRPATSQPSPAHFIARGRLPLSRSRIDVSPGRDRSTSRQFHPNAEPSTAALLEKAVASANDVSNLANSIDSGATKQNRKARTPRLTTAGTDSGIENSKGQTRLAKTKRRARPTKTVEQAAAEIVAAAVGSDDAGPKSRQHDLTPEGAEDHERAPAKVTMGELCEDDRMGRKSTRETEMQDLGWQAIKQSWKEQAQQARNIQGIRQKISASESDTGLPPTSVKPLMTINKDGQIVINQESTEIDLHAGLEALVERDDDVIEDRPITKRVNQSTIGRRPGLSGAGARWDDEATDLFYKGIRMFGTDMMMIASLFPSLSRRHIKLKYVKEERTNSARLNRNLARKDPVDLAYLEERAEREYMEDPSKFLADLEAQKAEAEAKERERIAREEAGDVEGETVLPSLEDGDGQLEHQVADDEQALDSRVDNVPPPNRFNSVADQIVRKATAPKKKRKQAAPSAKKTKKRDSAKRGVRPVEGIEERLGTVDEVAQ